MIAPWGASSVREAIRWGRRGLTRPCVTVLLEKGLSTGVGDEGGFAPAVSSNRQPLELIVEAINKAGYRPGEDIVICMDPASSEFYADGKYTLRTENTQLSAEEMTRYYEQLVNDFPIVRD
jgi:enolase (EC 4.2.1.11)